MKILMLWLRLKTFDKYFAQINSIAEKCERFYVVYNKGIVNSEWKRNIEFIKINMKKILLKQLEYYFNTDYIFKQIKNINVDLYFCLNNPSLQSYIKYFSKKNKVPYINISTPLFMSDDYIKIFNRVIKRYTKEHDPYKGLYYTKEFF